MKKIFLLFTAAMMTLSVASAQDINEATTNYNNGATELQMGNLEAALTYFQTALQMGESLGEPAAELVANCKTAICSVTLAQAKDLYNAKDFAAAVEAFNKAKEVAEGYGDAEVAAEAEELAAQANKLQYNTAGTAALRAKDYPTAIEAFKKVLELEPDNGNAAVQLGQAYYRSGQFDAAIEALTVAQANGQEDNAAKLLSQVYLKKAQAASKAKDYNGAIELCLKSNEYVESGNAYRVAASAAQKLGNNADTIKYYEKYLELSPKAKDFGGVAYTIAVLYQQEGNNAKAKEFYEKIVNDPQYGAAAKEFISKN
jgi:tetratricopeptide (TPR) repeat protein